jgi:hypothetical protein
MSYRNFRFLYPRVCNATGEKVFVCVPPEAPTPVYAPEYWISDKWDAADYGRDYDFSRPFFEQFKELFHSVPNSTTLYINMVDSHYCMGLDEKNCYMCFDAGFNEDSAYGVSLQKSRHCFETINCKACELCYWDINCTQCYQTFFSRNCTSCVDVWFSQDCVGCTDCFGCTNLRHKSQYIFNKPYSKEEYDKKIKEFGLSSWKNINELRKKSEVFWGTLPFRFRHGFKDNGCIGDYIYNAAEIKNCFFVNGAKNCAHCQSIIYDPIFDCMDLTSSGVNIETCYEVSGSGEDLHRTFFAADCHTTLDCRYIINCNSISDCFGCVGLRSKKYCILNKQYTKEEYQALLPKIIEHMNTMPYTDPNGRTYGYGEFFPPHMSVFAYNQSQAYEYFVIPKHEAQKMGFNWRMPDLRSYPITMVAKDIPDRIEEVTDDILDEVISCEHEDFKTHSAGCNVDCATAFRITKQELDFYRRIKLPLPRLCFNCRHIDRVKWRNAPALYHRSCMCDKDGHFHGAGKCTEEFETSYAPDRPEIVYCEKCYQQEVY